MNKWEELKSWNNTNLRFTNRKFYLIARLFSETANSNIDHKEEKFHTEGFRKLNYLSNFKKIISQQGCLKTNKSLTNHEEIRRQQLRVSADGIFILHHPQNKLVWNNFTCGTFYKNPYKRVVIIPFPDPQLTTNKNIVRNLNNICFIFNLWTNFNHLFSINS